MFVNNKKLYTGLALILSGLAIFIVAVLLFTKNITKESYDTALNTDSPAPSRDVVNKTEKNNSAISKTSPTSPTGSSVVDISKTQAEAPKENTRENTAEKNTENITVIFGAESVHLLVPPDTPFYDDLVQAQNAGTIHFSGKNYDSLGFFVTDIGELHSGYNKNLIYYINGKEATVGVSTYKPKNGDIINWKLE